MTLAYVGLCLFGGTILVGILFGTLYRLDLITRRQGAAMSCLLTVVLLCGLGLLFAGLLADIGFITVRTP